MFREGTMCRASRLPPEGSLSRAVIRDMPAILPTGVPILTTILELSDQCVSPARLFKNR